MRVNNNDTRTRVRRKAQGRRGRHTQPPSFYSLLPARLADSWRFQSLSLSLSRSRSALPHFPCRSQRQAKALRGGVAGGRGVVCDLSARRDREGARRGMASARASSNGGDEETRVDDDVVEFGYNRKDVILICTAPLLGGYLTYYGLQKFLGLNPIEAGNYVQVIFVFVLCVGWCATYVPHSQPSHLQLTLTHFL